MLKDYFELTGTHVGKTVFILGAGPSLHNQDIGFIHDHVVISVNSSILLMPWQTGDDKNRYWLSNDSLVRLWSYWPLVKSSKCHRIVRDSWEKYFNEIPDFYQFNPRPTTEDIINPQDKGLVYCSSVPSSIDLAIQMGCKRIYLLGIDQISSGDKTHFWQFLPPRERPTFILGAMPTAIENRVYEFNNVAYPALRKFAENKSVSIYNCNTKSKVEAFEKISLAEAKHQVTS